MKIFTKKNALIAGGITVATVATSMYRTDTPFSFQAVIDRLKDPMATLRAIRTTTWATSDQWASADQNVVDHQAAQDLFLNGGIPVVN